MALAVQCPYVAGDAVYMARSLYAQVDNTVFFNDLVICQPSSHGSERMLMPVVRSIPPRITSNFTSCSKCVEDQLRTPLFEVFRLGLLRTLQ
jgi:hypothetical protein